MTEIEWVSIPPGAVEMGSDNRSVLFGNLGPRHIFTISSPFEISKYPVESDLAREVLAQDEAHVASESEWERAMSIGAITGEIGTIEVLADSATNYWGKHCDGRPFIQENPIRTRRVRLWKKGGTRKSTRPIESIQDYPRRLVKRTSDYDDNVLSLPARADNRRIVLEEIVICTLIGIIPSFVWAYFNASQGYIGEGWLNLILGGVFMGLCTGIFWRPRTPTYLENDGMWNLE